MEQESKKYEVLVGSVFVSTRSLNSFAGLVAGCRFPRFPWKLSAANRAEIAPVPLMRNTNFIRHLLFIGLRCVRRPAPTALLGVVLVTVLFELGVSHCKGASVSLSVLWSCGLVFFAGLGDFALSPFLLFSMFFFGFSWIVLAVGDCSRFSVFGGCFDAALVLLGRGFCVFVLATCCRIFRLVC
ncbi:hypothetical protein Ancab_004331 [Ancistrocladus abbreviatus]